VHQASLIELGLVLFLITFIVLALSKLLLRSSPRAKGAHMTERPPNRHPRARALRRIARASSSTAST
jgi:hypothetical protein